MKFVREKFGFFLIAFFVLMSCKSRHFFSQKNDPNSKNLSETQNGFELRFALNLQPAIQCALAMGQADMFDSRSVEDFSPENQTVSTDVPRLLFFAPKNTSEFFIFSTRQIVEYDLALIPKGKGMTLSELGSVHWNVTLALPLFDGNQSFQSLRLSQYVSETGSKDLQFGTNQMNPYALTAELKPRTKSTNMVSKGGSALVETLVKTSVKFYETLKETSFESLERIVTYEMALGGCESALTIDSFLKTKNILEQNRSKLTQSLCTNAGKDCNFILNQSKSKLALRLVPMKRTYQDDVEKGAYYFNATDRSYHKVFVDSCTLKYANGDKLDEELIFVMSKDGTIFASVEAEARPGVVAKGEIYHSSFLQGSDVASAGVIATENGKLTYCDNSSGHYVPDNGLNSQFLSRLKELGCRNEQIPGACVGYRKD